MKILKLRNRVEKRNGNKKFLRKGTSFRFLLASYVGGNASTGVRGILAHAGNPDAGYNWMPSGMPEVPAPEIVFIQQWIDEGCLEDEWPPASLEAEEEEDNSKFHITYWREFDNRTFIGLFTVAGMSWGVHSMPEMGIESTNFLAWCHGDQNQYLNTIKS